MYFHLTLPEIAQLTRLQREWYLAIYAKHQGAPGEGE